MKTGNWNNIAQLIRKYRIKRKISQNKLAELLGYKHGQIISNVERNLAGLPQNKIAQISILLDIPEEAVVNAMVSDYRISLYKSINEDKQLCM